MRSVLFLDFCKVIGYYELPKILVKCFERGNFHLDEEDKELAPLDEGNREIVPLDEEKKEYVINILGGGKNREIRLSEGVFKFGVASFFLGLIIFVGACGYSIYSALNVQRKLEAYLLIRSGIIKHRHCRHNGFIIQVI